MNFWLASFPKTGNTFFRFVIANYINNHLLKDAEINFHNLGLWMPEEDTPSEHQAWQYGEIFPKLVKTHALPKQKHKTDSKVVYIMRDPRDTMLSFYHYARASKKFAFEGSLEDFVNHPNWGMPAYTKHIAHWLKVAAVVCRYESLMTSPAETFVQCFSALQLRADKEKLALAIEQSQPDRMREIELAKSRPGHSENFKQEFVFVRNATTAQWKTEMAPDTADLIMSLASNEVRKIYA